MSHPVGFRRRSLGVTVFVLGFVLVACGEDTVGQSTISGGGGTDGSSGTGLPVADTGADSTAGGETGAGTGGADSGEGGEDDPPGDGDGGGVDGDVCQGTQQGLCEEPGATVHC